MTAADNLRKLAYCVALSLAAHLLIIFSVPLQLLQRGAQPPPLEVWLQPTAPPPVLLRPRSRPTPDPVAEPAAVAPAPLPTAAPMLDPAPQAAPAPAAIETPVIAPAAVEDSTPVPQPTPPLARRLPRKGEITYALYLGNDRFNVGRTQQAWVINDDRYRLTSVSETTGLARLFSRQHLEYVSTGRLTASGLRPEFFGTERLRSGKTEAAAATCNGG